MIFLIAGIVFVIALALAILYFKVLFRVLWWMASTLAVGAWLGLAWVYSKATSRRVTARERSDFAAMKKRVDEALAAPPETGARFGKP